MRSFAGLVFALLVIGAIALFHPWFLSAEKPTSGSSKSYIPEGAPISRSTSQEEPASGVDSSQGAPSSHLPDWWRIPSGTGGAPSTSAAGSEGSSRGPYASASPDAIPLRPAPGTQVEGHVDLSTGGPTLDQSNHCLRLGIAASECTDFEAILKGLKQAWTAYTYPKQMTKNHEYPVALVLDATKTDAVSEQAARTEMAQLLGAKPEEIIPKLTKIARSMSASLAGASFKIEPSGPQKRTVTDVAPVEWDWSVTPTDPGDKTITLTLTVEVGKDEESTNPVQIKTLVEHINVNVSTWDEALSIIPGVNSVVVAISTTVGIVVALLGWLYRSAWLPLVSRMPKEPPKS
jgi:hypothetical protein